MRPSGDVDCCVVPLDFEKIGGCIFAGSETTAYRDPAAYFFAGAFHLFFTLVEIEQDGPYMYLATARSTDLVNFSCPQKLTPRDRRLNYSSPGNVLRYGEEYILCFQSYPRENGEKYGNETARLFCMRTRDFVHWSEPTLLRVKGDVPVPQMGRMIDPFLVRDIHDASLIWCLYKQNGISISSSHDMCTWTYRGRIKAGENPCILAHAGQYYLFHAPDNGVGLMTSPDMLNWLDTGKLFDFGADRFTWGRGRVTAGFVLDLRPAHEGYLMLFHASGPCDESEDFDKNASICMTTGRTLDDWKDVMDDTDV